MSYVLQFGIILGVSFAGEVLRVLLPFPIPASVYGLVLMLMLLCSGLLKPDRIRAAANFLIDVMSLMFVPATVGLITSWNQLRSMLLPFVLAGTVVTVVVMATTGRTVQWMLKGGKCDDRISE